MNIQKFTEKAQEAILGAQKLAAEMNHSQIETIHLLLALIEQSGGVVPQILVKLGADTEQLNGKLREELNRLPKVQGMTEVILSQSLKQVLDSAEKEAAKFKDDYVSTEHILMAMIDQETEVSARVLKEYGITRGNLY